MPAPPPGSSKKERKQEQQRREKEQRRSERRSRPLPVDPLERMNVLTQRLNIQPPRVQTAEQRSVRVVMECKRGGNIVAREEGCGTTVREAKRSAAEKMNDVLEREWLHAASEAEIGPAQTGVETSKGSGLMEGLVELAGSGERARDEANLPGVEPDLAGLDGDDEVDWGDEELIPYE